MTPIMKTPVARITLITSGVTWFTLLQDGGTIRLLPIGPGGGGRSAGAELRTSCDSEYRGKNTHQDITGMQIRSRINYERFNSVNITLSLTIGEIMLNRLPGYREEWK